MREADERERAAATAGFVGERGIGALVLEGGELGRMSFIEVERGGEEGEEAVVLFVREKEEGRVIFEVDLDITLDEDLDNGLLFLPLLPVLLVERVRPMAEGERVNTGGSRLFPFFARDW